MNFLHFCIYLIAFVALCSLISNILNIPKIADKIIKALKERSKTSFWNQCVDEFGYSPEYVKDFVKAYTSLDDKSFNILEKCQKEGIRPFILSPFNRFTPDLINQYIDLCNSHKTINKVEEQELEEILKLIYDYQSKNYEKTKF